MVGIDGTTGQGSLMSTKGERKKILSITTSDCVYQTFRCGGKGGQNVNKRDTGVRYIHPPSGARGESCDERSQWQNRKLAWRRMAESKEFQLWLRITLGQQMAVEAEATRYRENIPAADLKTEVKVNGRWMETRELA